MTPFITGRAAQSGSNASRCAVAQRPRDSRTSRYGPPPAKRDPNSARHAVTQPVTFRRSPTDALHRIEVVSIIFRMASV